MSGRSGFLERNLKFIFPLPAVICVFLLMIFPVFYTLFISFTDWRLTATGALSFSGLESYRVILGDSRFHMAFFRTFIFTLGAVTAQAILGTFIALVLHREFKGKGFLKFMMLLPLLVTPVAIGILFTFLFDSASGFFNFVLTGFGLPPADWINDSILVLPSLILVDVWHWTPLIAIIVLAGLSSLPREPFEAAKIEGASAAQVFFHITLPMILPFVLTAITLRLTDALKTYDIIAAITGGGPDFASETLIMYAFGLSFESNEYFAMGRAAATLLFLFLIVLLFSAAVINVRRKLTPGSGIN